SVPDGIWKRAAHENGFSVDDSGAFKAWIAERVAEARDARTSEDRTHRDNLDKAELQSAPSQIKSAAPFTYRDDGTLIPLSERFDSSEDDIRLSRRYPEETPDQDIIRDGYTVGPVYHGTPNLTFEEFDDSMQGSNTGAMWYGKEGHWFSPDKRHAVGYADDLGVVGVDTPDQPSKGRALVLAGQATRRWVRR
ncbi:MAG: hypothetical protein FJ088_14990, partial [Deltaproteobacteria bacterium]|nr:hypothetical protein [Deltaproteobacteria bacterium]